MKCTINICLFLLIVVPASSQNYTFRIDSLLKTYYSSNEPGAAILVSRNNKVLFEKTYGLGNIQTGDKTSSQSNFNIGSLTKQFTAFCILRLAAKNNCCWMIK